MPAYVANVAIPNVGENQVSWPVILSPYLERPDLWTYFTDSKFVHNNGSPDYYNNLPYWDMVNCPSNPPLTPGGGLITPLSYIINSGTPDSMPSSAIAGTGGTTPYTSVYNGVTQAPIAVTTTSPTSLDMITAGNGLSRVFLFSENTLPNMTWNGSYDIAVDEVFLTFVWAPTTSPQPCNLINGNKNLTSPQVAPPLYPTDYARPASNHPGGVCMAMCDGSTRFVSQAINYWVYQTLMTIDFTKSDAPQFVNAEAQAAGVATPYIVSDGDY